eukprot:scaffold7667_cov161-Amphora_coffeaeformis.AAC.3
MPTRSRDMVQYGNLDGIVPYPTVPYPTMPSHTEQQATLHCVVRDTAYNGDLVISCKLHLLLVLVSLRLTQRVSIQTSDSFIEPIYNPACTRPWLLPTPLVDWYQKNGKEFCIVI